MSEPPPSSESSRPPPGRPLPPGQPPYRDLGSRADVAAAWEARKELGSEYEEHIASGLADRVEELVAYRTAELRQQRSTTSTEVELEQQTAQRQSFVLGIVSLGVGVPITAISATNVEPGLLGVAVAWAGIVGVNLANRLTSRRRR